MKVLLDIMRPEFPLFPNSIGLDWLQEEVIRQEGHPFYHFLQSSHGIGIVNIADRSILLHEGEGILMTPFTPHRYRPISKTWRTNYTAFSGTIATMIPLILEAQPYYLTSQTFHARTRQLIESMYARYLADTAMTLGQIPEDLFALINLCRLSARLAPAPESGPFVEFVQPVQDFMDHHYAQPLHVTDLADLVHISPQYLIRLFKQYLATTPGQYLIATRITAAKGLLPRRTDLTIGAIAHRVGFNSAAHFIAVFKKYEQVTPEDFRLIHE